MFNEDNCVGSSQTETKPSNMGCEEKEVNRWVSVEPEKRVKVAEAVLINNALTSVGVVRQKAMQIRTYVHVIRCT